SSDPVRFTRDICDFFVPVSKFNQSLLELRKTVSPLSDRSPGSPSSSSRSFVCNQCGRSYRHASSLLNHKNSHKTGTYFCNSCQKEFPNLMSLKNHRRIHTEPKRYQCPDCGKSFRVSTALVCHRRIHTKEKPFSCQQCDKHLSEHLVSVLRTYGSDPDQISSAEGSWI
uniref:C2H2-type domain-containing protein n=1 Tax=Anabas testudineus TaxID=64144 RepID=A0A3Q1IQT7_ANATE